MSNVTQLKQRIKVPAQLIEEMGTGGDTIGIIGKQIKVVNTGVSKGNPLAQFLDMLCYEGAEGTVIHVSENGDIWADFGDDEYIPLVGETPETAVRVHAIGNVSQDTPLQYEIIGE